MRALYVFLTLALTLTVSAYANNQNAAKTATPVTKASTATKKTQAKPSKKHSHAHKGHGAHVHGEAKLNIVLNKSEAAIELETPANNVYGFEHAPKDEKQKQVVKEMNAKLQETASKLIVFQPDPKCQPKIEIETPFAESHDHDHDDDHDGDEHEDIEVEVKLKCAQDLEAAAMTVEVRKYFPNIKKLRAVVVTSKKQNTMIITTESYNVPK